MQSSSSKRAIASGSVGSLHQRSQCSKCTPSSSSKSGCSADCIKFTGVHRSTNRHIYVTNESGTASKSSSLPATPVSVSKSIDCRQCQMPMSCSSAPVTPTVSSPTQTTPDSNASSTLDTSSNASAFDFRDSNGDLSVSSSSTSSPSPSSSASSPSTTSPLLANQSAAATLRPICTKCSNMEIENNKTRTKLDQLRLVMQQRRERREARKMRAAPYGGRIIGTAAATTTPTATTGSATNPNDASNASVIQTAVEAPPTNPIVEQVNTLA